MALRWMLGKANLARAELHEEICSAEHWKLIEKAPEWQKLPLLRATSAKLCELSSVYAQSHAVRTQATCRMAWRAGAASACVALGISWLIIEARAYDRHH